MGRKGKSVWKLAETSSSNAGATSKALAVEHMLDEGTLIAKKALDELQQLKKVVENWEGVCERAAEKLRQFVRSALDESWSRTGLTAYSQRKNWPGSDHSGALYEAWVTKSIIKANEKGILVYIAAGMDIRVYKRAGAFQFGGVVGVKGRNKGLKKLRASLKKGVTKSVNLGGGVRVIAARPMYFDGGQIDKLAKKYVALVHAELAELK